MFAPENGCSNLENTAVFRISWENLCRLYIITYGVKTALKEFRHDCKRSINPVLPLLGQLSQSNHTSDGPSALPNRALLRHPTSIQTPWIRFHSKGHSCNALLMFN